MISTRKNALLYHALLLLVGGGLLLYLLLAQRFRFLCPFSFFAHLYCPGCGATRALAALLHLDLPRALAANPCVPLLALVLLYYEVAFLRAALRGRGRVSSLPAILFAYALLAFFLLRNLLLVGFHIDPLGDLIQFWR